MSQHPFFPKGFPLWVGFWLRIYFFLNELEKRKERFPLRSPWFREEECSWSREGTVEGQSKSWSGFQLLSVGNQLSLKMKITHQLLEVSVWLGFESTSLWNLPVFPLKKEMATQSSILAWRISWTGEPGRLGVTESDTTEQFSLTHLHFPLRVWNSLTFLVKFILPSTVIALHLTVKNPTLIRAVFLFYTKWIF